MDIKSEINEIRSKIIDRTLASSLIFILVILIPSFLRILEVGWLHVFTIHLLFVAILFVVYITKKETEHKLKAYLIFGLCFLVALIDLISFKTTSGAFLILVGICIAFLIFGLQTGLVYSLLFLISFFVIGYLHTKKLIPVNVDFHRYTNNKTTWFSQFASYSFSIFVLINVLNLYHRFFMSAIKKASTKAFELEEKNKELILSQERYRSILTSSIDGFLYVDKDFKIVDCNDGCLSIIGYTYSELKGKDYKDLLLDKEFDWDTYFINLSNESKPKNVAEINTVHKNGSLIPIEVSIYKTDRDDELYMWAVIKDLREKKKLENKIFKTMIRSEEKERERYAKELHDGIGPLLSTGMIYNHAITDEKDVNLKNDYAARAIDILNDATGVIKEISNNLSPLVLKEYGIVHAIRSFIEKARDAIKIQFTINDNLEGRFNELIEITLYRTLVELTNNSIKYSRAKDIIISFAYENNAIKIRFSDNGKGFDYKKAISNQTGFGLLNLANRIKKLDGKYSYVTSPGKGVLVNIEVLTEYL